MTLSETAKAVLSERYFRRDGAGHCLEDADAMLRRVAASLAEPMRDYGESVDQWTERFYTRMERMEFLPNSPTLMNAGSAGGQLAACFVLPVEDDLESIFGALKLAARIHQTGGGTGFSFSKLRPRNDIVHSTGGISSGPVSFIELFDRTTAVIRQGGRRRGANMAVLRVDHPDIQEFVEAKGTIGRLENFNLSVGITDEFLAALQSSEKFPLRNPRTGSVTNSVDAGRLLDAIVQSACLTGEPGLLFLDEINRHNPTPALGTIEATNPCGEQPLLPYESCTLGSLNLAAFGDANAVDWPRLREAVEDAVVFLDNVIDANGYPTPEIAEATRRTRKIGLGVMGFADLLAMLSVPYDSAAAVQLAGDLARTITAVARAKSVAMGAARGSFPAFEASIWPRRGFTSMRNAAVTCIAPTGTLSIIAGVSGGIEPFFALATRRRTLEDRQFVEINHLVGAELEQLGEVGRDALKTVHETGSLRDAMGLDELKRRFPIALEIPWMAHLAVQAAFQQHVDAAVSKTINLPADASPQLVREVFLAAAQMRLKGVTVYRYGSRPRQVLSLLEPENSQCRECAV